MASYPLSLRTHYTNWMRTPPPLPFLPIENRSSVFLKREKRWDVIDDERNSQCFRPRYPRGPPFLTNFPESPHLSPEKRRNKQPFPLEFSFSLVFLRFPPTILNFFTFNKSCSRVNKFQYFLINNKDYHEKKLFFFCLLSIFCQERIFRFGVSSSQQSDAHSG
jgi:hypothetical protein